MGKKKVRFVQVAISDVARGKSAAARSHIAGVDAKHRIWERFSDMPIGEWGQIEPPDEPSRTPKKARGR